MEVLSETSIAQLISEYPCRDSQIQQLACLLHPGVPSPTSLVVHGLEATGKSTIVKAVLEANETKHAIVQSRECITGRHLLERTLAACIDALYADDEQQKQQWAKAACENVGALAVQLGSLLKEVDKFALVFDGIDEQREMASTLLPALARFSELIPGIVPVFIVTTPGPRFLHMMGVPHIHFEAYSRQQAIHIVSLDHPTSINAGSVSVSTSEMATLWTNFVTSVYDSLACGAAHDIVAFRALCQKLWPPFVAPIEDGTFTARQFAKLMVAQRSLFQTEDFLIASVLEPSVSLPDTTGRTWTKPVKDSTISELPYYSKYLLCAAYLASYNPVRQDPILFMRSTDTKKRRRGGVGKGGGSNLASASHAGRQAKNRKMPRRLLAPGTFPLERLLAVFHAILPHSVTPTADLGTQVATLARLRLLVRSGIASGSGSADVLDASAKWKVNVGWDFVVALARGVGLEIGDYLVD